MNHAIITNENIKEQVSILQKLGLFKETKIHELKQQISLSGNKKGKESKEIKNKKLNDLILNEFSNEKPIITLYGSNYYHWLSYFILKESDIDAIISFDNHTDAYDTPLDLSTHLYHTITHDEKRKGIIYGANAMRLVSNKIRNKVQVIRSYDLRKESKLSKGLEQIGNKIAITIDLDVLISTPYERTSEATTDFSSQQLIEKVSATTLNDLLVKIKQVSDRKEVISVDICGHPNGEIDYRTIMSIASILHLIEKKELMNYNEVMDLAKDYAPSAIDKIFLKGFYKEYFLTYTESLENNVFQKVHEVLGVNSEDSIKRLNNLFKKLINALPTSPATSLLHH